MPLNLTPEVIVDFSVFLVTFLGAIATLTYPKTRKIKSLIYIGLGIGLQSFLFYFEAIGLLFLNPLFKRLDGIITVPAAIFFIIGINYIIKESYNSILLVIAFSWGILICYTAFLPDATKLTIEAGYLTINWAGLFAIIADNFQFYYGAIIFFWGLRTWLNAPLLIRKEAMIFFMGMSCLFFSFLIYLFSIINPIMILVSDMVITLGNILYIFAILKEPKLLYILPFKIYRIVVKDREGFPLFDHDWSLSNINETIFTGFINTVQLLSEEIMDVGGLLDINLKEGILIVRESEKITVGLVSSKSSKLLRQSLKNFTADFEIKFQKELKESMKDMKQYDNAYELIDKHFSNFPSRIIPSKKHPLLLSSKYAEIPLELDDKLKEILKEKKDYEFIKTEIKKSPICLTEDFLNLYKELKNELDKIEDKKSKQLDLETNKKE